MPTILAVVLCLLAQSACATAPETKKTLDAISADQIKEYATTLASDDLEGRCSGFPGNDKAANYIAARLKEMGLKPVGDSDVGGERTYFQVFLFNGGRHVGRNCAALLEGTDEKLKDEIVVIGAHFDHVGRKGQHKAGQLGKATKDDVIWNGADDNASGSSTILAVAKAFASSGLRPKRSILFMWFGAEEWGLCGSRWYVDHPLLPLEKTVAMINLDMVGRTDDPNIAGSYGLGTVAGDVFRPIIERAMKTTENFSITLGVDYGGGSDHASFAGKKIPVCGFGEKGPCTDYHRVSDHADKLDYPYMAKIARAATQTLYEIAELPERPKWNADYRAPEPKEDPSPKLGVYFAALEEEELAALGLKDRGGMRVEGLVDGSVAKGIGVLKDDVITGIDGKGFDVDDPRGTLGEFLGKVVRGKEYILELYRNGKRMELKAVWPELKK